MSDNTRITNPTRRAVIRGMGGMITLPFLEALNRKALAATELTKKKDPSRLVCMHIPGAIHRENWFPKDVGPGFELSPTLQHIARHRDDFSVLSGLSHMGNPGAHMSGVMWLTSSNLYQSAGSHIISISMDQVAARYLGKETYVPSMPLSHGRGSGNFTLSCNAQGVSITSTGSHRLAFEALFPPNSPEQIAEAQARVAKDKSILDLALGDIRGVRRRISQADQGRLDLYLDSIRTIENRLEQQSKFLAEGGPEMDKAFMETKGLTLVQHGDLMHDIIVLALQADMTRVITHQLGPEQGGGQWPDWKIWGKRGGMTDEYLGSWGAHPLWHGGSTPAWNPQPEHITIARVKALAERDKDITIQLGRLMDKLKAVDAHEGTLLDHTAILFGGTQVTSHSSDNYPTVLAGGKHLGFKHGKHLKWKRYEKPMSNLFLTILQQLGCPETKFGQSNGIISELMA